MGFTTGSLNLNYSANANKNNGASGETSLRESVSLSYANKLASGDGANKAEANWSQDIAILTSESGIIDLTGGVGATTGVVIGCVNGFGDDIVFTRLKQIVIVNDSDSNVSLSMTSGVDDLGLTTTGGLILPGSGTVALSHPNSGYVVVTNTSDKITFKNASAGTVNFSIYLTGSTS